MPSSTKYLNCHSAIAVTGLQGRNICEVLSPGRVSTFQRFAQLPCPSRLSDQRANFWLLLYLYWMLLESSSRYDLQTCSTLWTSEVTPLILPPPPSCELPSPATLYFKILWWEDEISSPSIIDWDFRRTWKKEKHRRKPKQKNSRSHKVKHNVSLREHWRVKRQI
jgi:hypothetical protein